MRKKDLFISFFLQMDLPVDQSRHSDVEMEDLGAPEWHVFDSEERYLGLVTMPEQFTPSLFRDDKVYGVWRGELNVEYVVRLRIVGDRGVGAT